MSTVQAYQGANDWGPTSSPPPVRMGRHVSRVLTQIDEGTSVQLARIDSIAEMQAAKIDALACIGRKAMQDVALLSQLEVQLAAAVPHAADPLAAIANLIAEAMGDAVVDTARRLGRWVT